MGAIGPAVRATAAAGGACFPAALTSVAVEASVSDYGSVAVRVSSAAAEASDSLAFEASDVAEREVETDFHAV